MEDIFLFSFGKYPQLQGTYFPSRKIFQVTDGKFFSVGKNSQSLTTVFFLGINPQSSRTEKLKVFTGKKSLMSEEGILRRYISHRLLRKDLSMKNIPGRRLQWKNNPEEHNCIYVWSLE